MGVEGRVSDLVAFVLWVWWRAGRRRDGEGRRRERRSIVTDVEGR